MFSRQKIGVIFSEFIATFVLSVAILGAAKYFNFTAPWYVGLAAGVTLATLVATLGRVSGAHANPAVTIGMWTLGKIESAYALVYVAAQMLGASVALLFFEYVTNTDILMAGVAGIDARAYTAELIGAAVFGIGVAAAVTQKHEGFYAALTIGSSLFIGVLIASISGPGFINPAVALANNTWDWTVVTAPIAGTIFGMNMYHVLLAPLDSLTQLESTTVRRTQRSKR